MYAHSCKLSNRNPSLYASIPFPQSFQCKRRKRAEIPYRKSQGRNAKETMQNGNGHEKAASHTRIFLLFVDFDPHYCVPYSPASTPNPVQVPGTESLRSAHPLSPRTIPPSHSKFAIYQPTSPSSNTLAPSHPIPLHTTTTKYPLLPCIRIQHIKTKTINPLPNSHFRARGGV